MTYYPIPPKPQTQSDGLSEAKERRKRQLMQVRRRRAIAYKKIEEKTSNKLLGSDNLE